jgi:alkylhydroperoxidase family enzyme
VGDDAAMTRIAPADPATSPEASRALAEAHEAAGARMTNMKWTAARSPESLAMLLTWYPLFDRIAGFLGERRAQLLSLAISDRNDCLICSTFFRRILIDAGEDPGALELDDEDELIVALGRVLAADPHGVDDDLHARLAARYSERQIVELIGFGAIMVATNVFNDALGVPLDDYLQPYRSAA